MDFLQQTLNIFIDLFITLVFLRVILSWMVPAQGSLIHFLTQCTEPFLKPIRALLPRMGTFDLSPLILVILLDVLRKLINTTL